MLQGNWSANGCKKGEDVEVEDPFTEEGKLLQSEEGKNAVYKNADGKFSAFSPL